MPFGPGTYGPMAATRLGGLRRWVRGGGFADPGGAGQERPGAPTGFTDLEGGLGYAVDAAAEIPGPASLLGKAVRAGTKAANAYHMDDVLEAEGFENGLTFGQQVAAAFGFNSYGTGGSRAMQAARAMAQRRRAGFSGGAPNNPGRARSNYRNTSPGRRGARDRGADGGGSMGGSDQGSSATDRDNAPDGRY